jgi:hypothetical protein
MAVVKAAVDAVAERAPRVSLVLKADIRPRRVGRPDLQGRDDRALPGALRGPAGCLPALGRAAIWVGCRPLSSAWAGAVPVRRPLTRRETARGRLRHAAGPGEWPRSLRARGFPVAARPWRWL